MRASRRAAGPGALAWIVAVLLGITACASPAPVDRASPAPVDYGRLETQVEQAISGGSVSLDTVAAVMLSVDGRTEIAHYRHGLATTEAVHAWSVTKSVTSLLIGIAIEDGLISGLDQTLPELLPTYRKQISADQRTITLRQLMDMSAGYPEDGPAPFTAIADIFRAPDATAFILRRGVDRPPGQSWAYSSSSSHLVSAVLAAALARHDGGRPRTVLAYAQEKLFAPLGIDTSGAVSAPTALPTPYAYEKGPYAWGTDRAGVHTGCCFLRLRPADLVKLGELVLEGGTWQGRRIVPEEWIAASIAPSTASPQYALMWWRETTATGQTAVLARGSLGQLIAIVPDRRLVVTVSSVAQGEFAQGPDDAWQLVNSTLLPAFV